MVFQKGYDPNRGHGRSRNPATAGVEIVRMDASAIARHEQIKNPASFASTGGWGGIDTNTWGSFRSTGQVNRNTWSKTPLVSVTTEGQW